MMKLVELHSEVRIRLNMGVQLKSPFIHPFLFQKVRWCRVRSAECGVEIFQKKAENAHASSRTWMTSLYLSTEKSGFPCTLVPLLRRENGSQTEPETIRYGNIIRPRYLQRVIIFS